MIVAGAEIDEKETENLCRSLEVKPWHELYKLITKERFRANPNIVMRFLESQEALMMLAKMLGTIEFLGLRKINKKVSQSITKLTQIEPGRERMIYDLCRRFPSKPWHQVYTIVTKTHFKPLSSVSNRLTASLDILFILESMLGTKEFLELYALNHLVYSTMQNLT